MLAQAALGVETLLQGVLGVVPGIALVGEEIGQPVGMDGQVGVEVDAGAAAAEIPVVARPRLVLHHADLDRLILRQRDDGAGPLAQLGQNDVDEPPRDVRRNDVALPPGHHPLADRSITGQETVEVGDRRRQVRLRDSGRLDVEEEAHLFPVGQLLPCQPPRRRQHGRELLPQIRAARLWRLHGGDASTQVLRGRDERRRFRWRRGRQLRPGLVGAEVGVDVAGDVPLDAEGEAGVFPANGVERRFVHHDVFPS